MALLPIIVAQYSQGPVCVLQRVHETCAYHSCTHETCAVLCVPQRVRTHSCGRIWFTQTIFVLVPYKTLALWCRLVDARAGVYRRRAAVLSVKTPDDLVKHTSSTGRRE